MDRNSLEKAIVVSEQGITAETDGVIFIDKTAFASRKRGRVALSTMTNAPIDMNENEVDEVIFWRRKYDEECHKQKVSEQQIELYKQKESALEDYSKLLEEKLAKVYDLEIQSNRAHVIEVARATESEERVKALERKLSFYKELTGVNLKEMKDDDGFICTVKNIDERKLTQFGVVYHNDAEFRCTPEANAELLPDYLQGDVLTARTFLPQLLGDVLSLVFSVGEVDEP